MVMKVVINWKIENGHDVFAAGGYQPIEFPQFKFGSICLPMEWSQQKEKILKEWTKQREFWENSRSSWDLD